MFRTLFVAAIFVPFALAQWPAYRISKTQADLAGPAPRASDGKPDFSGIWDRGMAITDQAPPKAAPVDPGRVGVSGNQPPAGPRPFQDLPSAVPGGLPLLPGAAEYRRQRKESNSKEHPDAHCLPLNPVQLHSHPQPRKKSFKHPGEVVIIYEANGGLRQIFTDGRPLPGPRCRAVVVWIFESASGRATPWWWRAPASATISGWMKKARP